VPGVHVTQCRHTPLSASNVPTPPSGRLARESCVTRGPDVTPNDEKHPGTLHGVWCRREDSNLHELFAYQAFNLETLPTRDPGCSHLEIPSRHAGTRNAPGAKPTTTSEVPVEVPDSNHVVIPTADIKSYGSGPFRALRKVRAKDKPSPSVMCSAPECRTDNALCDPKGHGGRHRPNVPARAASHQHPRMLTLRCDVAGDPRAQSRVARHASGRRVHDGHRRDRRHD
jgi:hypothetical protein